jgi:ATP synthase protein I
MNKINPPAVDDAWNHAQDDSVIKPLTREEARAFREANPTLSPWLVLACQACGGVLIAFVAWWFSGEPAAGWSAMYGAMTVVVPSALFARGLMSKVSMINPAAAVTGFFLWELVKIGLVLAMLFAAPKLISDLSWPAMLVGLVVTMKVVWLVLWLDAKARRKSKILNVG